MINAINSIDKVRYIVIFEDVIIAVPSLAKHVIVHYCRDKDIRSWEEHRMEAGDRRPKTG